MKCSFLTNMFRTKPRTFREVACVPYSVADKFLAEGWKLAPEEDYNKIFGMVYLERPLSEAPEKP